MPRPFVVDSVTVLIGVYATLLLCLLGLAGYVAIWVRNAGQRADAYRVLKLVLAATAGAGGLLALLVRLAELS